MRIRIVLAAMSLPAALAACGVAHSPFVRIEADNGRVYYAHTDRTLHSGAGGFLSFRDLVTRESVRLENGTYRALECPREEVRTRQVEYANDPSRPPRIEDYGPER